MIWFACKKCGKRHGRSESLSGTLVFCECGFGNRVPWSSTVEEPEAMPEPAPIPVPPPARPRPSIPVPAEDDRGPEPERFRRRPRKEPRRVNPKYCLNHDETPVEHRCAHCNLPFCSKCVLTLQGETLCGPCKNFRVRGLQRPSRLTPLAVVATVVGVVSGPVCFFLTLLGIGFQQQGGGAGSAFFALVAVVLPAIGLVLGGWALRDIETKPRVGGRALAMTGAAASLVGVLWSLTIAFVLVAKQVQS